MFYLLPACAIAWGLYLAILLLKFQLSLRSMRREAAGDAPFSAGEITIVQPILGGDPRLADVLRQTLRNTPQATRFLWLVDSDDSHGRNAVEPLCREHAGRIEILWCDRAADNVNPKAYKLDNAWPAIATPYAAVLDDDTTISERNLRVALAALERCDLYTGIPCYRSTAARWDSLLAHFVNNNSIMTYLSMLPLVGPLSINGMFYVMRTETLRLLGGFAAIQERLCDDYALARLLLDGGRRIHQGIVPQYLRTSVSDVRHYAQIMHRWFVFAGVLVRDQRPGVQLILLAALGLPPLLLWSGLIGTLALASWSCFTRAHAAGAVFAAAAMGIVLIVRYGLIRFLHRRLFDRDVRFRFGDSILSELLQPIHGLHALLVRTIRWRTRRIRVHADGTFEILER
jgi:ceramide glucosyltransferase